MNVSIDDIKNKVTPILKEAGIRRSALFGSYVRGDNTDGSDIDILVDFPEDTTLLDVAHLQRTLEARLGKKVDLVSYNAISPLIKASVLKHQYPLQ